MMGRSVHGGTYCGANAISTFLLVIIITYGWVISLHILYDSSISRGPHLLTRPMQRWASNVARDSCMIPIHEWLRLLVHLVTRLAEENPRVGWGKRMRKRVRELLSGVKWTLKDYNICNFWPCGLFQNGKLTRGIGPIHGWGKEEKQKIRIPKLRTKIICIFMWQTNK